MTLSASYPQTLASSLPYLISHQSSPTLFFLSVSPSLPGPGALISRKFCIFHVRILQYILFSPLPRRKVRQASEIQPRAASRRNAQCSAPPHRPLALAATLIDRHSPARSAQAAVPSLSVPARMLDRNGAPGTRRRARRDPIRRPHAFREDSDACAGSSATWCVP